nr:LysR substrate-binding domain-containing protein [uncultured Microbacterium sp.]
MATPKRRPARASGKGAPARRNKAAPAQRFPPRSPVKKTAKIVFDTPRAEDDAPRTFRLGVIAGATPGKWIDAWKTRMPKVPIELVPLDATTRRELPREVDAALVRLPVEDDTLHTIALYDEVPVVVAAIDSHLLAVDELTLADLAGEVVITPSDDVLGPLDISDAISPTFAPLPTGDSIATAATGVGIVIVPMSLARLHHRKDADHRPLLDGPVSTVALVWLRERTTPDVETFVGIVRGRTSNSSR